MPQPFYDAYGHQQPLAAPALTAGAVSTTAVGTIAPTTAAGATPTVTAVNANDRAGTFTLNPVTGGGAQAAGSVVQVTFAQPYADIPKGVLVNVCNNAAGAAGVAVAASAQNVTPAGFTVNVAAVLVTANNYNVFYQVEAT
jgi:predicted RNA-binding protein associated with RNAse of E/G family